MAVIEGDMTTELDAECLRKYLPFVKLGQNLDFWLAEMAYFRENLPK